MPYSYITIPLNLPNINSRNELRKYVVLKFMEESPGSGTGSLVSRYKYIVETFSDSRKLYLKRPATYKMGFDFQIWMENWNNLDLDIMPSHSDIIQDLKIKKRENQDNFRFLLQAINNVYICEDDDRILNWLTENRISFDIGENLEILIKVIKWMFIEQDIRYWNFSGRSKLKRYIDSNFEYSD